MSPSLAGHSCPGCQVAVWFDGSALIESGFDRAWLKY